MKNPGLANPMIRISSHLMEHFQKQEVKHESKTRQARLHRDLSSSTGREQWYVVSYLGMQIWITTYSNKDSCAFSAGITSSAWDISYSLPTTKITLFDKWTCCPQHQSMAIMVTNFPKPAWPALTAGVLWDRVSEQTSTARAPSKNGWEVNFSEVLKHWKLEALFLEALGLNNHTTLSSDLRPLLCTAFWCFIQLFQTFLWC